MPLPRKCRYHARSDIVGDLSAAVRSRGMRMGPYYSGGYDRPYNERRLRRPHDEAPRGLHAVPDGVVNDRWSEPTAKRGPVGDTVTRGAAGLVQRLWQHLPEEKRGLSFPAAEHFDFRTPVYASFDTMQPGSGRRPAGWGTPSVRTATSVRRTS